MNRTAPRTARAWAASVLAAATISGPLLAGGPASASLTAAIDPVPMTSVEAAPDVPNLPAVPDTPNVPNIPETPDVPNIPNVPETPDVPNIPSVPETPDVPNIPNVPETPDVPNIPSVPETPDVPNIPETPDVPSIPSVPETPDVPSIPSIPETPDVPSVPETPDVPSVPETPDVPSVPETPDVPTVPSVPTVPVVPDMPPAVAQVSIPGIITLVNSSDGESAPQIGVTSLEAVQRQLDADGNFISSGVLAGVGYEAVGVDAAAPADIVALAPSGTSYECVYSSTNQYFYIGRRASTAGGDNVQNWRYQFQPYSQYYARRVENQDTFQVEICANGGADGQNGYRTFYNASIMADNSRDANRRIGLTAGSGENKSQASAAITFQASKGPVSISSTLNTSPAGRLGSNYGRPKYESHVNSWVQTESVGFWSAGCTFSRTCGSPNMQNQVHQGLFEYFHGTRNVSFPIDVQWDIYCANPYGVGCG